MQSSQPSALSCGKSWIESLSPADLKNLTNDLTDLELGVVDLDWRRNARPSQMAPRGNWNGWLVIAGRGWGKTRVGAEYVRAQIESGSVNRVAFVSETSADGRDVMVEGESGILAISNPAQRPLYEPSKRRLTWPNGAIATLYDAREPDQLRGPQHDLVWFDELAKFRYADAVFDQAMFGLRLGHAPRWIATTTPRPIALIKRLMKSATPHPERPDQCSFAALAESNRSAQSARWRADARGAPPVGLKSPLAISSRPPPSRGEGTSIFVTRGKSDENLTNLAAGFRDNVIARYRGTRLGRQELDAEILEDVPGALWTRRAIDETRVDQAPELQRIVVGVDPAASSGENANETGIVVMGLAGAGHAYVLEDWSLRASPDGWARKAVAAYRKWSADCLVAEANQGGEMVERVIRSVADIPVKLVRATRGKYVRAEPISALYEQGRVHHVGVFPELEDQMVAFTPDFAADCSSIAASPDRMDALVWAATELFPEIVAPASALRAPARQARHPAGGWMM